MNIWGVMPNIGETAAVKPGAKASGNQTNYTGPSFAQSMGNIARSANMQVAGGATASSLNFNRKTEELFDEPFSFTDLEEEMVEDHIQRIKHILKDLGK